jgi:hypothetical protein
MFPIITAMNKTLLEKTLDLARKSELSKTVICKNIKVTVRWYDMLLNGQIKDPGVNRIQRLYDYLEPRTPIEVDE